LPLKFILVEVIHFGICVVVNRLRHVTQPALLIQSRHKSGAKHTAYLRGVLAVEVHDHVVMACELLYAAIRVRKANIAKRILDGEGNVVQEFKTAEVLEDAGLRDG